MRRFSSGIHTTKVPCDILLSWCLNYFHGTEGLVLMDRSSTENPRFLPLQAGVVVFFSNLSAPGRTVFKPNQKLWQADDRTESAYQSHE